MVACAIATISSAAKAIASYVRRGRRAVSHGRRVKRGSPGITSTARSASPGIAMVSASRRLIVLVVSAGGACAGSALGQAAGEGRTASRANAAVRSLAQGQLACIRSVAVRAWNERRAATCNSR